MINVEIEPNVIQQRNGSLVSHPYSDIDSLPNDRI